MDKISFTGSTTAGRRLGAICDEPVARLTLELDGKSAGVVLDDADIDHAAAVLAGAECFLSDQVCASLTRIIVSRSRDDELLEALAAAFSPVWVGDAFDARAHASVSTTGPGPSPGRAALRNRRPERAAGRLRHHVRDLLAVGASGREGAERNYCPTSR